MLNLISETLRPKSFNDLVLDDFIKQKLQKMFDSRTVMNMIFYGKPGSGKTSAAKIFTQKDAFDVLIINGSLDTSIDVVRTKIMNFVSSYSLFAHQKICFIDEADYLSKSSQASLRGVIEQSSSNCRFIFTANDMSKMHTALTSRLLPICFDMTALQIDTELKKYKSRVIEILKESRPHLDEHRVLRVIEMNFPDYRSIANKLEFELL